MARWEYQVVEEPNPVALQERLMRVGRDGWEPTTLGYAGECRLLALIRRPITMTDKPDSLKDAKTSATEASACR
jgi:hypothetical protein